MSLPLNDLIESFKRHERDLRLYYEGRDAEIERLRAALDQLLDDMGEDGLCVCQQAKNEARAALAGEKTND